MKHAASAIGMLLSLASFAQDWAPIGATWHYSSYLQSIPPTQGVVRLEATLDTIVNGQATRKVELSTGTSIFTHLLDGVVWIHVPSTDAFDTLYNFNAVPGDRWSFAPLPDPQVCLSDSWVEVLDTGTVTIDDIPLRWLAVNNHNVTDDSDLVVADTIVERLGSIPFYMLPHEFCNSLVSPGVISSLRCYLDHEISYMDPLIQACDPGTGIRNTSRTEDLGLFPNPGRESLNLPSGFQGSIIILDARGSIVLGPIRTSGTSTIDVMHLASAVYSVHLLPSQGSPLSARWAKW